MNKKNHQKGFTLIESLVAIAIGGMLLGVIVPSIIQVIRQTDLNNIRITAANQIENTVFIITASPAIIDIGYAVLFDFPLSKAKNIASIIFSFQKKITFSHLP